MRLIARGARRDSAAFCCSAANARGRAATMAPLNDLACRLVETEGRSPRYTKKSLSRCSRKPPRGRASTTISSSRLRTTIATCVQCEHNAIFNGDDRQSPLQKRRSPVCNPLPDDWKSSQVVTRSFRSKSILEDGPSVSMASHQSWVCPRSGAAIPVNVAWHGSSAQSNRSRRRRNQS